MTRWRNAASSPCRSCSPSSGAARRWRGCSTRRRTARGGSPRLSWSASRLRSDRSRSRRTAIRRFAPARLRRLHRSFRCCLPKFGRTRSSTFRCRRTPWSTGRGCGAGRRTTGSGSMPRTPSSVPARTRSARCASRRAGRSRSQTVRVWSRSTRSSASCPNRTGRTRRPASGTRRPRAAGGSSRGKAPRSTGTPPRPFRSRRSCVGTAGWSAATTCRTPPRTSPSPRSAKRRGPSVAG